MNTEIYLLNIKESLERPVDEYLKFFSNERIKKILRYKFNADRNRTVFAELLARKLIAERTGKNFEDVKIFRNENGRPVCEYSEIFFSISHSGCYVACSIGDSENGADVETLNRRADINIAKRFFLPNEYEILKCLDDKERVKKFFEFWTLKEAALKCRGLNEWSGVDCERLIREGKGKNFYIDNAVIGVCVKDGALTDEIHFIVNLKQAFEVYNNSDKNKILFRGFSES